MMGAFISYFFLANFISLYLIETDITKCLRRSANAAITLHSNSLVAKRVTVNALIYEQEQPTPLPRWVSDSILAICFISALLDECNKIKGCGSDNVRGTLIKAWPAHVVHTFTGISHLSATINSFQSFENVLNHSGFQNKIVKTWMR